MKDIEVIFDEVTFTSDAIIVFTKDINQFYNFLSCYYCGPQTIIYRIYDGYYRWFRTNNKFITFDIFIMIYTKLVIVTKDFNKKQIISL